jgi:hypothetical protein
MAVQEQVDKFELEGVSVTVSLYAEAQTGAHTRAKVSGNGWTVSRTWRFGSYNRAHCRNFARKIATDEEYRQRCLSGKATWAQVEKAYSKHRGDVLAVFEPPADWDNGERGGLGDRASGLASRFCQEFYEGIKGLLSRAGSSEDGGPEDVSIERLKEDICRRAAAEAEALRKALGDRGKPLPTDHRISFGEHEGKTLTQIAEEDPGYAEWALEELEERPRLQRGLACALRQA